MSRSKKRNPLIFEELEPRLLLSADLAGIAVDLTPNDTDHQPDENDLQAIEQALQSEQALVEATESEVTCQELVIIDPATPDYQSLVDDLISQNGNGRSFEIVLLDSAGNGIEQIDDILNTYQDLDAVHILSHGSDGGVQLGDACLNLDNLSANAGTIESWHDAFSEEGDLLIYGCDLATSEHGQSLVEALARLTGADVAASDDLTGHEGLGGDWDLEHAEGVIETKVAFSEEGQRNWTGILATDIDFTNTDDPAHHWKLDGDAVDSVGSADGTITDATTVTGLDGDALRFDESGDYVTIPDVTMNNDFTVTFQFKVDDNTGSLFQYIYSHGDINTTNSLNIFINEASHGTDPNVLRTVIRDADDTLDNFALEFDISSIIGDDEWHTYTLTVEAGVGSTVYLDGVVKNTDTRGGGSFNPSGNVYLGARYDLDPDRMFGGDLDDVKIYDHVYPPTGVGTGLLAGTVIATDPVGGTVTYSLVDDAGGMFSIDSDTGELFWTGAPDTSTTQSYDITVRVTDSGAPAYDEVMTITTGTSGPDTITGTSHDDLIYGLGDNGVSLGTTNHITNGSFESGGSPDTTGWSVIVGTSLQTKFSGTDGVVSTDGSYYLDSEAPDGNNTFEQTISGLTNGNDYQISFDAADAMAGAGNSLQIYFGGVLLDTLDPNTTTMQSFNYNVTAGSGDGSNELRFVEAGGIDGPGTAIDNVRMYEVLSNGGDTIDGGDGDDILIGDGITTSQSITLNNAGFEEPALADNAYIENISAYGWTLTGNYAGIYDPNSAYGDDAYAGDNVGYAYENTLLNQTLSTNFDASNNYELTVQVGNPEYRANGLLGGTGHTYAVRIFAGATLIGETTGIEPGYDLWEQVTVYVDGSAYQAADGDAIKIELANTSSTLNQYIAFDDVQLTETSFPGDDTLTGGAGDDYLDGGAGTDTAIFSGNWSDYTITENAGTYTVIDTRGSSPDGTDTVKNVEFFQFADLTKIAAEVVNSAPTDIIFDSETAAEQDVNTYGTSDQIDPAIAAFDDGGYITVWVSNGQDGSDYGIYGQRFDADGSTNGVEFLVTSEIGDSETNPSVTTFSDGGFVVAWQDQTSGVMAWTEARVFDADGTAATAEFKVSPGTNGDNEGYQPAVLALNANEFVVLWANEIGGATYQIVGQIYDRTGSTVGSQFTVGSLLGEGGLFGAQTEVTLLDDGGFAATWRTNDGSLGTRIAVMNSDGSIRTAETTISGADNIADIASLSNGNFVVTYDSGGSLKATIYDANGTVSVSEFNVNTTTSAARYESTVTRSDDGFVVVWESSAGDGSGSAILAQRFDASGNKIDGEVVVNETTTGNQQKPEVIETASGKVVAVWQSENVDAALTGIVSKVVATGSASINENAADGTRVADVIGVYDLDAADTHTFSLTDDAGGRFAIDANTGVITVANGSLLDYETNISHDVTVRVTDSGSLSHDEVLTININNQGGEPAQSLPGAQNVDEDGTLTFSSGNGNAVTVSDTSGTDASLQVTLTTTNGILTLSQTNGLSIPGGSNGSSHMVLQGLESDINAALEGMIFTPSGDFNGAANVSVTTAQASQLAGYYSFDAGTAIDDSVGISQNGSLVGNATTVTDGTRGEVLSLDGSGDYVLINDLYSNPADVTLSAWVNFTTAPVNGGEVISIGNDIALRVDDFVQGVTGFFWDGSTHQFIGSGTSLSDGNWHHLAFSFNDTANTQNLYIDGTLVASANFTSSITYTGWFPQSTIGAHADLGDSSFDYNGLIDDARIYDRALSADEIATLAVDQTSVTGSVGITVNPVNDAPVLDNSGFLTLTSISEDETNNSGNTIAEIIASDGGDRITDIDAGALEGIAILSVDNSNGTWEYNTGSGWTAVGSVSGTNSLLLRATDSMRFVPDGQDADMGFVTFCAWDQTSGTAGTKVDTSVFGGTTAFSVGGEAASITVTAVNDDPIVVNLDGDVHNYTEGDGIVLLEQGSDAVVSDVDSANFNGGSLTVEVDSGLQVSEDVFSIRNEGTNAGQIGVSGSDVTYGGAVIGTYTGGTGLNPLTVNLNTNATPAAVTALVQNITYENSNIENPTSGSRSVVIDITDGDGGACPTQNLILNVSSVNDAPVVDLNGADGVGVDFATTFTEDAGAVNVADVDATISDVDSSAYENLSINLVNFLDGASEQIVVAGYTFTYGVSDTVIRTVGSTSFELDFDGTGFNVMLDGSGGMPAADLQTLLRGVTYENTSQNPTAGDRAINIFAQDSSILSGPTATSTITVNPQNDAPTATNNANSVSENGFVSGNVITDDSGSGVDSDPEGDGLQVTQVEGGAYTPGFPVTLASGAQVTFQSNGSYTYNTNGQFDGLGAGSSVDDSFTYQISDDNGGFDTATVTVTINGSNDAPSITSAGLTLDEGETVTLSDANFAVTDADDTAFTYTVSGISGGYFQLSSAAGTPITSFTSADLTGGLVQFVDNGDEVAPVFSVTVNDGDSDSNTLAATINYTPVNDSLMLVTNSPLSVPEEGTRMITNSYLAVSDADNSATQLAYTLTSLPSSGSLRLSGSTLSLSDTFTQDDIDNNRLTFRFSDDASATSFAFTVSDGTDIIGPITFSVNGQPVNDAPVNLVPASCSVNENVTLNFTGGNQIQISDIDHNDGTMQVQLNVGAGGLLTLGDTTGLIFSAGDGADDANMIFTGILADINAALLTLSFTPTTDFNGDVNFTIITNDQGNSGTDPGLTGDATSEQDSDTFTITVNPVNDAPVLDSASLTLSEGQTVTLSGANFGITDPDDSSFTYTLSGVTGGYFQLSANPGVSITAFSSAQLTASDVQFVDDGNEVAPTFSVTVNDGDADSNTLAAAVTYTATNEAPTFHASQTPGFTAHDITTTADRATSVTTADVDGDGDVDVLSASAADDTIAWYENDGAGNFSTANIITTTANGAVDVTVADMDGDGDLDVLSASFSDDTIAWYENDGSENFTAHTITTAANGAETVTFADMDGDGDLDVLSASYNDDTIAWYENDGSENFTPHDITTAAIGARDVTVADMDGDGDLDVLTASYDDDTIAWYENDGSENFTAHNISTAMDGAYSVTTADMDGDGDLDVLSASAADDTIAWHENDGSENFTAHDITTTADSAFSVTTADVDGDGDLDVLSASAYDDTIAWYENDGSENFTTHTITTGADFATRVTTADVDGDGDLDVLSASDNDDTIAWYENDGGQVNTLDGAPTFTEGGAAVVLDADVEIFDAELSAADNFNGATLTLERNGAANADDLYSATGALSALTEGGNLIVGATTIGTVTTNSGGTLVLTFNANATNTLVNSAMQQIAYSNSNSTPPAGVQIDWIFDDGNSGAQGSGGALQAIGSTTVSITAVNYVPVATADSITVAEGGTATTLVGGSATVLNNDTGLGDTPVNVSLVTNVTQGSLTLNSDGTFSYTHNGSENFNDSFTYRVTDNDGQTSDATVNITVTPVSDETPVAVVDTMTVAEGATITTLDGGSSTVLNNDTGLGDTPVTVSLVTGPAESAAFTLNTDGTFSYTHNGSENFTDSFTYRVTDNDGQTSDATVNITVTPVSDATPVAVVDTMTVAEGATITTLDGGSSTVLNNDTGLGDTPVTVSLVTGPAQSAAFSLNTDGTFSYTHNGTENFTDSFTYRVTDNDGQTSDATVNITVTPVSDETPVAVVDTMTVAEGATITTLNGGSSTVLNNDTGLGDTPVTVSLVTGPAQSAAFTLNADGTFSYTHNGSENFTDSFTYRVTDNDGQTSDATVTINVTPVSDATPVAVADTITVAEGGTATSLVGGATDVLSNDTGLGDTPVTVSLVTGPTQSAAFTLNADGTFSYTHNGTENFTDSFTYRITDNDGQTADATVAINITPVSDATPVAVADTITVAEGATITTLVGGSNTVLNNDTGLSDTPVTVSLVTGPTQSSAFSLNADGTFSYTHNGTENFTDSFTYRVTDNDGQTADATVAINITPVSDATPVAVADTITVAEGATITTLNGGSSTVLNNDTGLGDTPVTVSLVTGPTQSAAFTLNTDGTFSYTHNGSENFSDSFTYRVTDNDGQISDATVTINVTPVSDATPVAVADTITVAEGATITTLNGGSSTVLNNDTGLGDTPVTVSLVTGPTQSAAFTLNADGTFSYTHNGSENFSDSFTYRVTDNDGQISDATVNITVTPVSDETPVAVVDTMTVAEGATITTLDGGSSTVLNNDTGLGDTPVTVSLVTGPAESAAFTLNTDGTFSYTHNGTENFTDSFTYRVTDNDGQTSDATVNITVTPVSDETPVAVVDTITVAEGATITTLNGGSSTVLNNDTGLGDTPVTVSLVTGPTQSAAFSLNADGTFSYTHNGSENFSDSFTYRVTDNDGQISDATVTINVTPVSDATPVAVADTITVAEGATITTLNGGSSTVLNNDTGLGDTPVTVSLVTGPTQSAAFTLNADGTFSYTHNGTENFTDSITYRITDNDGQTADATVAINITPVSDATPIAVADTISVAEGGTATSLVGGATDVLSNDTGLGDTPVTVSLVTGPTQSSAFTLNADGTFSYTHNGTENFNDSFTYRVTDNDGQTSDATVTINVTPVSDATPIAVADTITVAEGATITTLNGGSSTVLNNDTGLGDTPVTVSLVTGPIQSAAFSLNADGTFSYTHNGTENFNDSFTYRVTDNDGQTSDATVTINVTPVSDATPIAVADTITVAEGATITTLNGGSSTVLNNDTGLGDTPVTVSLVTGPIQSAAFSLNADGTFSYTHNGSENFNDSFTYRVTDNDGQTSDATVTINVTPVSDATPVAVADTISVAEGGTATSLVGGATDVLSNDTGLGDTPVTVSLVTGPTQSSAFTLNADGTFIYTHNGSENFTDSFTYRMTDNDGQTSDATVTINVTPVSDATPVAVADTITVAEGATITTLNGGSSTVLNNDTGLGDTPVTVSLVTGPTQSAAFTLNADGTFSYTHNGTENFTDSFTYRVTDQVSLRSRDVF
ncbi:MAG: tandem-95 repeat protein [Candidatus Thiodiazotropha sp.]|nr:tandem-95 repeat protein [Candidatus Thiodiazotropha sp.]